MVSQISSIFPQASFEKITHGLNLSINGFQSSIEEWNRITLAASNTPLQLIARTVTDLTHLKTKITWAEIGRESLIGILKFARILKDPLIPPSLHPPVFFNPASQPAEQIDGGLSLAVEGIGSAIAEWRKEESEKRSRLTVVSYMQGCEEEASILKNRLSQLSTLISWGGNALNSIQLTRDAKKIVDSPHSNIFPHSAQASAPSGIPADNRSKRKAAEGQNGPLLKRKKIETIAHLGNFYLNGAPIFHRNLKKRGTFVNFLPEGQKARVTFLGEEKPTRVSIANLIFYPKPGDQILVRGSYDDYTYYPATVSTVTQSQKGAELTVFHNPTQYPQETLTKRPQSLSSLLPMPTPAFLNALEKGDIPFKETKGRLDVFKLKVPLDITES